MIRIARPGPRERLAPDHALRHPELLADPPDLVLEEHAQRLDELHLHVGREAADVVVRLDRLGDPVGAARLDHVGVERPLDEPANVAEAARLVLEDADELLADHHPLALRIGDPGQLVDEAVLGLHVHERHVERAVEGLDHLLRLALPQQAMVDEDARQLVADRPVHEQGSDRRVDAAGERAEHALVADLGSNALDLLLDHRGRCPRRHRSRHLVEEVLEHVLSVRGVDDLGVELHTVEPALGVLEGRDGRVLRRRDDPRAGGRRDDRVAVRHPDRLVVRQRREQLAAARRAKLGAAELGDVGAVDAAAELEREQLSAVTDAERRDAELEERRVEPGEPSA